MSMLGDKILMSTILLMGSYVGGLVVYTNLKETWYTPKRFGSILWVVAYIVFVVLFAFNIYQS